MLRLVWCDTSEDIVRLEQAKVKSGKSIGPVEIATDFLRADVVDQHPHFSSCSTSAFVLRSLRHLAHHNVS